MKLRSIFATGLLLGVFTTGCGGGSGEQPFAQCGNGVVDSGEECDPSFVCEGGASAGAFCSHSSDCGIGGKCRVHDNGPCLSTCRTAFCGDGYVYRGEEQCDRTDLDGATCASLGFEGGAPSCTSECRYDLSACGEQLASTPTPTVTATATAVRTATPTPPVLCGNGVIDEGETCDDSNTADGDACPPDCRIELCSPSAATIDVTVSFDARDGAIASLSILLAYPDGQVQIPGRANDAQVRQRVTDFPSGSTGIRNDLDYELRVLFTRLPAGLTSGALFNVKLDVCTGASIPPVEQFSCRIEGIASGVSCAVTLP